jgi:type I restriction enzyme M protein
MNKINMTIIQKPIEKRIWASFEMMRDILAPSEQYFVLYLYVLKKEGLLKTLGHESKGESKKVELLVQIDRHFSPIREKLGMYNYEILLDSIDRINFEESDLDFAKIFDSILYKLSTREGKLSAANIIPLEISKIATSSLLYKISEKAAVYNPFAGTSSFGILLNNIGSYFGQEINPITWSIGILRLLVHGKLETFELKIEDSTHLLLNSIIKPERLFDLIIAAPPFGLRIVDSFHHFNGTETCESLIIKSGLNMLKNDGKIVILVSNSFLYNQIDKRTRELIIENDFLETIISFPGSILLNTNIQFSLLVINKNKAKRGIVKLINAETFIKNENSRKNVFNETALINLLNHSNNNSLIREVPNDFIISNDLNLNIGRYFQEDIDGVEIGGLVEVINGQRLDVTGGKLLKIRNLKDDVVDNKLNLDLVDDIFIPTNLNVKKITETCVLLALRWKSLKPTYFEYDGTPIYITSDIIALRPNIKKLDIYFFIQELYSKNVLNQTIAFLTGVTVPMLRREDLLKIKIQIPNPNDEKKSIAEQKAMVKGALDAYFRSRENEIKIERELRGVLDDKTRELQSIKHTFRQYLSALISNVSGSKKFIKKNEGVPISLEMIYSKNLNQTFGMHLQSLEDNIQSLNKLLESVSAENISYKSEKFNIIQLVKEAQMRFKQEDIFIFDELFIDKTSFEEGGVNSEPHILISQEDFYILFSNIITNAKDHGFIDSVKPNHIKISLCYDKLTEMVKLEIANNGKPIPESFTLKHLITKGEKTSDSNGTGIGGSDINYYINKHKGKFDIINLKEEDFPVTYIIEFPLVKTDDL